MRVSEYFELNRIQPGLDFVDVDLETDLAVFVDPRALRLLQTEWARDCVSLVKGFFDAVLESIRNKRYHEADNLLGALSEPNETHLGLSEDESRGRALGSKLAERVRRALSKSEAVQSGLLEDLEDTILLVKQVAEDLVSDIVTNVIRKPLIHYTQDCASAYGIPLQEDVASGPLWDPKTHQWYTEFCPLPMTNYGKLLLVPKIIVRRKMEYSCDEYYHHYLLEHLRLMELESPTRELVRVLKDGRERVTKKALISKYGRGKTTILDQTLKHPDILRRYRSDKQQPRNKIPPLTHAELAAITDTQSPDWDTLAKAATTIPTGTDSATEYHRAVSELLSALFYPMLMSPTIEDKIHGGRKRIDITFDNGGRVGFFYLLALHYHSAKIFIECKNYSRDIHNPELDQLAGRFSPQRGQCGLILCRTFDNKELFIQRCVDTAKDGRGYIIVLDDDDVRSLVFDRKANEQWSDFPLLRQRFDRLIN